MKKFTVVYREDFQTRIFHVSAISPQHAHEHILSQYPDFILVAIFPGWHDEA